jgi:hypothetical protein
MSDLTITLLLAALVCLEAFAVIAYVLVRGSWWRP